MRPRGLLSALAIALLPLGGTASGAAAGPLHLSVSSSYERDPPGKGLTPEATPGSVTYGWPVRATLDRPLCADGTLYRWSIGSAILRATPTGPCSFIVDVPARGATTITLTATGADGVQTANADVVVAGRLIVSIGDSVASGEGVPDTPGGLHRAEWQSAQCHRSARAAPARAAQHLQLTHPLTPIAFVSVACSGAETETGLLGRYAGIEPGPTLDAQLDVVRRIALQRPIDALVISIGANDLHFSDVIHACVFHPNCWAKRKIDGVVVGQAVDDSAAALPAQYAKVAARLADLPIAHVYLTEYFDPTTGIDGGTCGTFGGVVGKVLAIAPKALAQARERILNRLTEIGRTAAGEFGWTYVEGAAQRFQKHGYCARDSWIVPVTKSFLRQRNIVGTMHPNAQGHEVLSELIAHAVGPAMFPPEAVTVKGTGEDEGGDVPDEVSLGAGGLTVVGAGVLSTLLFRRSRSRRKRES
jgi:GDSL-like Lipase/Acylhydrolase family